MLEHQRESLPTRVAVIGGMGHLGAKCMSALNTYENLDATALSRSIVPKFDLNDPETFGVLSGYDLVVDLAESSDAAPSQAITFCLDAGKTFIECSSCAPTVEALHRRFANHRGPGRLVIGAGVFTGLSNLLVARLIQLVDDAKSAELLISSSPLSGAGASTCELMALVMRTPSVRFESGRRIEHIGIEAGPIVKTFDNLSISTLRSNFAEPYMIQDSHGLEDRDVLFRPVPSVLIPAMLATPAFLARSPVFGWFLVRYFRFLRMLVLRKRVTPVSLDATVHGHRKTARGRIHGADGMQVAAQSIAAIVATLRDPTRQLGQQSGCYWIDQVVALQEVLDKLAKKGTTFDFDLKENT